MRLTFTPRRAAAGLGAVILILVLAWLLDLQVHRGQVARNVRLSGEDIGGKTAKQARAAIARVAAAAPSSKTVVDAPAGRFSITGSEIGLRVDQPATLTAVMGAGRHGNPLARFWGWFLSPVRNRTPPVALEVDRQALTRLVQVRDPGDRLPPREPEVYGDEGEVRVRSGQAGRGVDVDDIIAAMPAAAGRGFPIRVKVARGLIEPNHTRAEAEVVAAEAERLTARGIEVAAGNGVATVSKATLRSWVGSEERHGRLVFVLDEKKALDGLAKVLEDVGTPARETGFRVVEGEVQVIAGVTGTGCCAPAAVARVTEVLLDRRTVAPDLPLKVVAPTFTVAEARALGIKQAVGSFTTRHPTGQPRVKNIHRIADMMRGTVIKPGQTISVNELVGKRTAEKGFVVDHVIEDGKFAEGVGGGVSQFATTLFNAAFFAGLDLPEYQSHSIYISRYPYGREATLNYPKPDLKVRNPTPHGVLIWPSYTGSSITVTLYSTRFVEGAQTGQTTGPQGSCTRVRTQRTKTYRESGEKKIDYVVAVYRAEEGLNCNQQPTSTTTSSTSTTDASSSSTSSTGSTSSSSSSSSSSTTTTTTTRP